MPLLDPSNDFVFKLLFREPSDERRLIAMLTAILEPDVPIVSATVLNPDLPADIAGAKSIRLDLLVALADGRRVNIEMESWPRPVFIARELYYWAKVHVGQLKEGERYDRLRPTIAIAWLGNPYPRRTWQLDPERVHTRYRIQETETGHELTDHLEIHLLDLCNLGKDATLSPALRRWAEFFDHPNDATLHRLAEEDTIMAETVSKLAAVSEDEVTKRLAFDRWFAELGHWQDKDYERQTGLAEGEAIGLAKGLRTGIVAVVKVRFGDAPAALRARLELATVPELERMLEKAPSAANVDELLAT